ncbi:venom acid phosphatase Acph-1-like [Athalia rosae]|uniref:venom acid phosphatase Acph-1-like n=1 Tax=Athalia rosae TaxID=37344 RepID=UPI002033CFF9|nr:venom acid phosphatase Acph-1-like [Athalia rosae]
MNNPKIAVLIILSIIVRIVRCNPELKLVQVLFRHGDRAPNPGYEKWYPTDPYINERYAPVGLGGLTEEGSRRSFELGQFLRERYFSKLQMSEYSESVFRVRSSDIDRCRKSAEALVSALFPDTKSMPIYQNQLFKDPLFVGVFICPVARSEKARAERFMRHGDERWSNLYEYLSRHLGVNATRHHAFILHHTLMAQRSFGLTLPNWTRQIYPSEELETNAGFEYILQSYNTKLKRINGGLWIREFLENMDNSISGKDRAKMLVYAGHETNVAGFLTALDIFKPHVPDFCSCLILEMYEDPRSVRERYVRLFYKKSESLEELHIPGCSVPCSLKDFRILTDHLTPQNTDQECGLAV